MTEYFIDYATSSRDIAVAVGDERPHFHQCTVLGFISGEGNFLPVKGKRIHPPLQSDMFPEGQEPGNLYSETGKKNSYPTSGDIVIIEKNFEPHDPWEANRIIDYCADNGITLHCMEFKRGTGKAKRALLENEEYRESVGIRIYDDDSDENDLLAVDAIRLCYREGQHPTSPKRRDVEEWQRKTPLEKFQAYRTAKLFTLDPEHAWIQEQLSKFPYKWSNEITDHDIFDTFYDRVTGRRHEPKLEMICLVVVAAEMSNNRKEYDRLIGMYQHALPRVTRASCTRRAGTLANRMTADAGLEKIGIGDYNKRFGTQQHKELWKDSARRVRRATRAVFHMMKGDQ